MKFTLFFLVLFVSFFGLTQQDSKIDRKVKRFEYAIRDAHRLGFNNDFKKSDALNHVITTRDSLAKNCPISLNSDAIVIDQTKLINWITTYESEYQNFIAFLEVYIRKNI
ncbi:MAG: hypothetical protein ACK5B9_08765 [Flavobacteriia bacterium]|jgi:hypothetical protein